MIKQFVAAIDNITAGGTKIVANSIHVDFGIFQFEILKKNAIEVVIVVLSGVSQNYIKVLAALVDNSGKTDNLRTSTNNYDKFQFTILLPLYIAIIKFRKFVLHYVISFQLDQSRCLRDRD